MKPADSVECRPWFCPPRWAEVMPLLIHSIQRDEIEPESAQAARVELLALARGLDAWNERAPRLRELLTHAWEASEATDHAGACAFIEQALELAEVTR